ncbi:uncharacterized protein [Miscanthus floridulus]|uniref:uncharacterized protein isoform X2 n=1 Tax=Miscanthus floridulus TaxID=154761 RepID=UPI003458DD91
MEKVLKYEKLCPPSVLSLARGSINACLRYPGIWWFAFMLSLYALELALVPQVSSCCLEKDKRQAARLRSMFNDILWKMVIDDNELIKISKQAYEYERSKGDCLSRPVVISHRDKRSPFLWWGSFCGLAYELQSLAKRIISLCFSTSGCGRDWSAFANVHNRKRIRLEYKRLTKLVYVSYNRKMSNKFKKTRELGSKGKICNPLLLEEFEWENEWVDENCESVHAAHGNEFTWANVHETIGATESLRGHHLPRAAAARAAAFVSQTYARRRKRPRNTAAAHITEEDDSDHDRRCSARAAS